MDAQIIWDDALAVGVASIDDQHREMIDLLARFLGSLEARSSRQEVENLLRHLQEYVHRHFEEEEQLQQQVGFPEYPEHKREHEAFKEQFSIISARVLNEDPNPRFAEELTGPLLDWLVVHIQVRDKALASFMQNQPAA